MKEEHITKLIRELEIRNFSKKTITSCIFMILAILIFVFVITKSQNSEVCFESKCIDVKIADDVGERSKGLMFVSFLKEDEGMLFIFDEQDNHAFWMKNTLISLDIIWISEELEIVHIVSAEPCDKSCPAYAPEKEALYVLEANRGWAERNEIEIGDLVQINI